MISDEVTSTEIEETLQHYRTLVQSELERYLPDSEPAAYLYDLAREYPARGGKGIRPALLLATCQAFGGSISEALPNAVAIELLHNAFLIHDDIEDDSRQRRGAPTLHVAHGVPLAINTGDALAVLSLAPLRDQAALGTRLQRLILDEYEHMNRLTVEGQATELGWRRDNALDLDPDDYLDLIMKKTCWYTTIHPLRVGALIGSRGTADLAPLTRFGFHLGAAFQIRDDLLNLVGSEELYGKEILGDLREGKRTLMLIHLISEASGDDRDELTNLLGRPEGERTEVEAERIFELMQAYGSLPFAQEYGRGIASAADTAFEIAFAGLPASPHRDFVQGLIPYMLSRTA